MSIEELKLLLAEWREKLFEYQVCVSKIKEVIMQHQKQSINSIQKPPMGLFSLKLIF